MWSSFRLVFFFLLGMREPVNSADDALAYIEFDGLFEKFYVAFRLRGLQAFTGWPDYGRVSGILWAPAMIVEGVIGARRGVRCHGVLLER